MSIEHAAEVAARMLKDLAPDKEFNLAVLSKTPDYFTLDTER